MTLCWLVDLQSGQRPHESNALWRLLNINLNLTQSNKIIFLITFLTMYKNFILSLIYIFFFDVTFKSRYQNIELMIKININKFKKNERKN